MSTGEDDSTNDNANDNDVPVSARPRLSRRMLLVRGGLVLAGFTAVIVSASDGGRAHQAAGDLAHGEALTSGRPPVHSRPTRVTRQPVPRHAVTDRKVVPADPVYYVDDGPKVIALTIDDGPSPVYTPQVLQILEKYHVKASFSMIGRNVRCYPKIARDVADAGHTIVNHTWDHHNLAVMPPAQMRTDIIRATDAIYSATGARPGMFRAPYGAWSRAVFAYCASAGLTPLDWSVDPRDWALPGVAEIVANIMANTRTGSIILEHDGGGDRSETVAALKIVVPRLLDEGYRFSVPA